jgi:hypothetical protein
LRIHADAATTPAVHDVVADVGITIDEECAAAVLHQPTAVVEGTVVAHCRPVRNGEVCGDCGERRVGIEMGSHGGAASIARGAEGDVAARERDVCGRFDQQPTASKVKDYSAGRVQVDLVKADGQRWKSLFAAKD